MGNDLLTPVQSSPVDGHVAPPPGTCKQWPIPLRHKPFRVTVSSSFGYEVVNVLGDVDAGTVAEFSRALDRASGSGRPVLLDITSVEFMCAAGYSAITASCGANSRWATRCVVLGHRGQLRHMTLFGPGDRTAITTCRHVAMGMLDAG